LETVPNLKHFSCSSNSLTGQLPDFSNVPQLQSFHFQNNFISGSLPSSLALLNSIEQFYGFNNQLEGCYPLDLDNLCKLGSSVYIDSIGYNLSLNPQLPWQGDVLPFCLNEPQSGQPCDDQNPETQNDIIQNDCTCAGSTTSSVTTVSPADFQIYPNPTSGIINLPNTNFRNISLFNSTGKELSVEINTTLDLSPFPIGVYYLKIQTENNIFLKKVVKK